MMASICSLYFLHVHQFLQIGFDPIKKILARRWCRNISAASRIRTLLQLGLSKKHDRASWCLDCLCKEGSPGSIPFSIEYIEKIYVCYWLEALVPNFCGLFQFVPLFSFTLQFDFLVSGWVWGNKMLRMIFSTSLNIEKKFPLKEYREVLPPSVTKCGLF